MCYGWTAAFHGNTVSQYHSLNQTLDPDATLHLGRRAQGSRQVSNRFDCLSPNASDPITDVHG